MKKLTLTCALILFTGISSFAQQENSLPETGNVGIGTTSPSSKLDVNGSVKIDSTLNVKDSMIVHKNAKIKKNLTVDESVIFRGLASESNLDEKDILFLDSDGKIVRGNKANAAKILGKEIYEPKECGTQLNPTWANGTNVIFTSCPEVNVGINNPSPRVKLDVNGITYATNIVIGNKNPANISNELLWLKAQNNNVNTKLVVIENPSRKLLQLDNSGLLRVREVKLDTDAWPDFVFDEKYKLRSLAETEKYILENKHLPEVPNAATMLEEGINVAEMDQLLLQKIEELTLYLIEQNKKLEKQAQQIQKLENQLNK